MTNTPVVLMDLFLTCSGPENLAGVPFQRAELENCVKPTVMTSATKITSPLGSNVLLRCDTTGYPTPNLYWAKTDGSPVNNTGMQTFECSRKFVDLYCLICKKKHYGDGVTGSYSI